jgi:hypothetical protein
MAKLKVIEWRCGHAYITGLTEALGEGKHIAQHHFYVAAPTKKFAVARLEEQLGLSVRPLNDVRAAAGNYVDAMVAAGLFEREGIVLVTSTMPHYGQGVIELTGRDEFRVVGTFQEPDDGPRYGYRVERKAG